MSRVAHVSVDVENDSGTTTGAPTFETAHGTDLILDVCRRHGARPTLFVTGELLDLFPDRVRAWSAHAEIASHGYHHVNVLPLDAAERRRQLERAVKAHEAHLGQRPAGYRAVQHCIDAAQLRLVEETGFSYDSSVMPRYPIGRRYVGYRGRAPIAAYRPSRQDPCQRGDAALVEVPVTPAGANVPLSGTWMRVLGRRPTAIAARSTRRPQLAVVMHNWDAVRTEGIYAQNCGEPFLRALDDLLGLLRRRGYALVGCGDVAAQVTR